MRYAVFELNPIMKSTYYQVVSGTTRTGFMSRVTMNHRHPYTIAANVVWLIFCGWLLALAHVLLGLFHMLTVVGIPTGVRHFSLIPFVLWPFGRKIETKTPMPFPPTLNRRGTQTVTGSPIVPPARMPPTTEGPQAYRIHSEPDVV